MKAHTSSVECKKVVSDTFGEIEFLTDIKSAGKMTHFSYNAGLNSKYLYFYGTNKTSKNNRIQRKSEHKIAFPAKLRKCTYDLLAFNRRLFSHHHVEILHSNSCIVLGEILQEM